MRGEHAQIKGFRRAGLFGSQRNNRDLRCELLRDRFDCLEHVPMPVKTASGEALADDQEIDIALGSCLSPSPGGEQGVADKVLSRPRAQDAQEALQIPWT